MLPRPRCWSAAQAGAGRRPGTHKLASCDRPTCRVQATCAPGRGHCETPVGRRDHSSVPGCGASPQATCGSLAGHITEEKKSVGSVTTRRRKVWVVSRSGRGFGPLAACAFGLGMLGSDLGILASLGLSPRGLPTVDLAAAFRLLTIALIPGPGLILSPTPFAQADPRSRSASSTWRMAFALILRDTQGRLISHGKARGECVSILLGSIQTRTRRWLVSLRQLAGTRQRTRRH